MSYAAKIIDNIVARVIVGEVTWAESNLGGIWVACGDNVGVGWIWNGSSFIPPIVELDNIDNQFYIETIDLRNTEEGINDSTSSI